MDLNKDYILITGVAGFIGMHVANKFLSEGFNVIGIDNENSYYFTKLKKDRIANINPKNNSFVYFKKDIIDRLTWEELDKFKIISLVHLAAQAGVRHSLTNPWDYVNSNIIGFQRVLDFVNKKKITKFLYASSSSVYGKESNIPFIESSNCNKPESYYAATKIANELMAYSYQQTHDLISIGLRFFTVYGPWGRPDMAPHIFVKSAFSKNEINVFNFGNQKRDFTYIDDIVKSIFLLFKKSNKVKSSSVFNIGNGSPVNLGDFIEIIEKTVNIKLKKNYLPAQKGDVEITFADTSKLESIIDYRPNTGLKEGVMNFVKWYKEYYEN